MRYPLLLLSAVLVAAQPAAAQTITRMTRNFYKLTRNGFSGENAYATVGFVEQRFRVAGNTGFNESIAKVEEELQQAGFVREIKGEREGPLTYRIEKRPLRHQAWDPLDASVTIAGENEPLLSWKTNRNMLAINSGSTAAGGITAELVYVGKGTAADFDGKDVKGKIIFGETSVGSLYAAANQRGAIGVLNYNMPAYTQPEKHPNSIQFTSVQGNNPALWAILVSFEAKERLKAALANGPVKVSVMTKTRLFDSEELTVVANVNGTQLPDERFVFSAHVQEPGANDNASGVGTLAEMARLTAALVKSGKLKPLRTLTFLWGEEITSTRRYITEDTTRRKGIKWGMSLDMVGEDTKKTGGTFLIEKMQDPSAIWTRGNDKHTEWGASEVSESALFPHYYNDFVLNRCLEQGKFARWVVNTNPFEGGSDHTPFLQARIPGLLLWHFTDVYYHTDGDRLEMVSPQTMKNVGVSALVTAYTLITGNDKTAVAILNETFNAATARLSTEFALSTQAVKDGKKLEDEQHILTTWYSWYDKALETTNDIETGGSSATVLTAIAAKREELKRFFATLQLK